MTSANNGSVVLKPKATSARYSGGSVTFTNFSYDV
jgi:hypothetical protein